MGNAEGIAARTRRFVDQNPLKTGCALVAATFLWIQAAIPALIMTGDEPRYVFRGLSLLYTGSVETDLSIANDWVERFGYDPFPPSANWQVQSFVHTAMLSPILHMFGLEGGRWAQVLLTAFVFSLLTTLNWPETNARSRILALTLTLASPTCAIYSAVMYTDIWLACLFAMSLYFLYRRPLTARDAAISIGFAVVLPLFHIRGAPLALACGLFVAVKAIAEMKDLKLAVKLLTPAIVVGGVGVVLFAWHQYALFGGLTSSSSPAIAANVHNLSMQLDAHLLGYRHGLLVYFPTVVMAFAGLVVGAARRSLLAYHALAAIALYAAFMIWGTASESYATRFWTALLPSFFVGFAFWFQSITKLKAAIAAVLVIFQFALILQLADDPSSFLANRYLALPLISIAPGLWHSFDIQSWLSFELHDLWERAPYRTASSSGARLLIFGAIAGGLLFAAQNRNHQARWLAGGFSAVLLLAVLGSGRLTEVPVARSEIAALNQGVADYSTTITLPAAEPLRLIYVGDPNDYVIPEFPAPQVRNIVIEGFAPSGERLYSVASMPGFAFYLPARKYVATVTFTYSAGTPFPEAEHIRAFK